MRLFGILREWRKGRQAAAAVRRRAGLRDTTFIAITGSHGKTTATAILGAILSARAPTHVAHGQNTRDSMIGTLRRMKSGRRYCVQEMSGHKPGAIGESFAILEPQVGIVTAVADDHWTNFRTRAAIAAEKSELVRRLPADGLAVINADDPLVAAMAGVAACRVVTFGRDPGCDLRLLSVTSAWPHRLALEVEWRGERFRVATRLVGAHWHVSVAAALLAALELGSDRETCLAAIAAFEAPFNRMSVHQTPNGAIYVLDANKGAFAGMEACLSFLADARAPRKTVVMGDLADFSGKDRAGYYKVARLAMAVADRALFVGENAARVRRLAAGEFMGRIDMIASLTEASERLATDTVAGELIYIKSSHGAHMERLVLARFVKVDCWRVRCGKLRGCATCRHLPARRLKNPIPHLAPPAE